MTDLTSFAEYELRRAGYFDEASDYGGAIGLAVLKMIEAFAAEGHSGGSASVAVALFSRLARFEPISPLTGEDDEWTEVSNGVFQNRRAPRVFKENGEAYDSGARVFRDPNGSTYLTADSRVPVTFPYMPKIEIVDREQPNDD